MMIALTIIHVVISVALVLVVLLQHGKQQGLSGAIAGGAETFFGKNKGRTVDAMLKKFTAVVAILFIVSSIVLTTVAINEYKAETETTETTETAETAEEPAASLAGMTFYKDGSEDTIVVNEDGQTFSDPAGNTFTMNEEGNVVDGEGNVVLSADYLNEQLSSMLAAAQAEAEAAAAAEGTETVEGEAAEEAPVEETTETEATETEAAAE